MPGLVSSMAIGATTMFFGDVIAQKIYINMYAPRRQQRPRPGTPPRTPSPPEATERGAEEDDEGWDLDAAADPYRMNCGLDACRSVRLAAIGGLWVVPNQYGFYCGLDLVFPQSTLPYALLKVAIEQGIFSWWCNGSFLFIEALTRTGSWRKGIEKVQVAQVGCGVTCVLSREYVKTCLK